MKHPIIVLAGFAVLSACQPASDSVETAAEPAPPLNSGIDFAGMDTSVRPQDDFYSYANGSWVEITEIPGDQSGWGRCGAVWVARPAACPGPRLRSSLPGSRC